MVLVAHCHKMGLKAVSSTGLHHKMELRRCLDDSHIVAIHAVLTSVPWYAGGGRVITTAWWLWQVRVVLGLEHVHGRANGWFCHEVTLKILRLKHNTYLSGGHSQTAFSTVSRYRSSMQPAAHFC